MSFFLTRGHWDIDLIFEQTADENGKIDFEEDKSKLS
jgi:hypothetical protein